jgi:hypothetical protein
VSKNGRSGRRAQRPKMRVNAARSSSGEHGSDNKKAAAGFLRRRLFAAHDRERGDAVHAYLDERRLSAPELRSQKATCGWRRVAFLSGFRSLSSDARPWQAWRRPTLPRLKTQYHRRWSFSRPSSGWDRVFTLRQNHQASKGRIRNRKPETGNQKGRFASSFRFLDSGFLGSGFLVFWFPCPEGTDNESNQANRAISTG